MSRIRLVLAWLLMAALPLQGLAAASMLFCGAQIVASAQTSRDGHVSHAPVGHAHDEAAQAASVDHAAHGHGSQDDAKGAPGSSGASQADQDKHGHACPI